MRYEEAGHRRIPPIQSLANTVDIARETLYVVATEPSMGIDSTGFDPRQSNQKRDGATYDKI